VCLSTRKTYRQLNYVYVLFGWRQRPPKPKASRPWDPRAHKRPRRAKKTAAAATTGEQAHRSRHGRGPCSRTNIDPAGCPCPHRKLRCESLERGRSHSRRRGSSSAAPHLLRLRPVRAGHRPTRARALASSSPSRANPAEPPAGAKRLPRLVTAARKRRFYKGPKDHVCAHKHGLFQTRETRNPNLPNRLQFFSPAPIFPPRRATRVRTNAVHAHKRGRRGSPGNRIFRPLPLEGEVGRG
jgi:hypothetical protein